MGIKLDFSDVDTGRFGVLPNGLYGATIAKITQEKGKSSGKPYLAFVLKLHPDEDRGAKKGQQVYDNYSLQPKALWKLKQLLVRLGWSKEELEDEIDFDPSDLIGREVVVELTQPNAGYDINQVKNIYDEGHTGGEGSNATF